MILLPYTMYFNNFIIQEKKYTIRQETAFPSGIHSSPA